MPCAALERLVLAARQGWSSQDLVKTLSPWSVRRFELFRAQAAQGTLTTRLIVERVDAGVTPPGRRLESCWFGTGCRTKVRAWDAAVKVANSRGQGVPARHVGR